LNWFRYWDLAASTKTQADFSASAAIALDKQTGDVFIRDLIHLKAEWPEVRKTIMRTAQAEPGVEVGVESAMHGLAGFQELQREPEMLAVNLRSIRVDKDKVSRALPGLRSLRLLLPATPRMKYKKLFQVKNRIPQKSFNGS